jgi:hypothetical protein
MEWIDNDISRSPQRPLGTIGGDQGTSFVAYHRAAMRVTSGYTLVASAFSSDPTVSEEAGQALGAEPDPIYADYAEMVNCLQAWLANDPSKLAKAGVVRRLANNRLGLRRRQRALDPE